MIKTNSYLDEIMQYKIREVSIKKHNYPLKKIKEKLKAVSFGKRDFAKAIKKNRISLIAEIKKASPSRGIIKKYFDHQKIAALYEEGGADALSMLTDEHFFMGDLKFIKDVKKVAKLPVLRKDFIFDEYQLYESRLYEADAVLLIARILDEKRLKEFIEISKSLGMQCLIESNSYQDIEKAVDAGAEIIGINNRNLESFNVDMSNFQNLSRHIPKDIVIVCESGILSRMDVEKARLAGADAILVGTALMQSGNIKEKISELIL